MKMSGNSVKAEGSTPQMATYSQQAGFPTIAPAPAQGHTGIMSTHQGQFQVISSPPFATSAAAQNTAATAQYIPQFATYNQQGQLVLSPANFPPSAYGGQQIILTAAPGMAQANPGQQSGGPSGSQGGPKGQTLMGAGKAGGAQGQQQTLVPMSQPQGGYTLTHNGLVHSNGPGQPTFMFTNPSHLMGTSQGTGLLTSLPEVKNDANKAGGQSQQGSNGSTGPPPGSLIMHNGMAYSMNPQGPHHHQQAILSSNGQIILRAHDPSGGQQQQQQQIMFSPLTTQQQQQLQSPTGNASGAQNGSGNNTNLQPPTLQPMSSASTIRQITVSTASVSSQSGGAPPGKTAISRALPPILPTTRPTYTLPQTPISQSSLGQQQHHQAPSPKSKNKFSPRGGVANSRAPGPNAKVASILKQPTNILRAPPPGGPPVLSQQQPPSVNPAGASQPPTLQPMHTVAVSSSYSIQMSNPPILAAPSPPSAAASPRLPPAPSPKGTSSSKTTALLKTAAAKPSSTPPPTSSAPGDTHTTTTSEAGTPKAFVKPNVLTHVIDGHIIQESSQPFPLETEDDKGRHRPAKKEDDQSLVSSGGPPVPAASSGPIISSSPLTTTTTMAKAPPLLTTSSSASHNQSVEKKRGPGRPPGSTRQNIDSQRIPGSEVKGSMKDSGGPCEKRRKLEDPLLKPVQMHQPLSSSKTNNNNNPLKWSVQQVCDFVKSLHGCAEYVEDFMLQEIDGQALMLLKTEHLMAAMSIKLGPALKICSAINEMREEVKQQV